MSKEYPPGDYENWDVCRVLDRHTEKVVEESGNKGNTEELSSLLTTAGSYKLSTGAYGDVWGACIRAL